ncbi:GntR family transcriptional regulator [Streptomyces sp. NPDC050264]|uniref:GntR family transcriptional regulator n=1 Tax=Streptomyces sp. NPDC050264 TaxID=3155038 RepID=UPI0034356579
MTEAEKPDKAPGPLDPHSATPLYVQLADVIEAGIRAGSLAPDRPIPSENAMADEYGVARLTARRAAQELRERGLIVTVRGKGSFVAKNPPVAGGAG